MAQSFRLMPLADIGPLVEQSDIEKAPTFAPPASPAELDQVM
jgi:hypothetical protein